MYKLFTSLVLLVFLVSAAGATDIVSTDGEWWNGLTDSQQVAVMFGSTSSYSQGYFDGSIAQAAAAEAIIYFQADYLTESQSKALIARIVKGTGELDVPDFSAKAIGTYIEAMSSFYSHHPEAIRMNFSEVLKCIEDKPVNNCDDVASRFARSHKPSQ